jgi:hypothetical protein
MTEQDQTNHILETRLYEYLDGALSPRDKFETDEHLQICSTCQAQLNELQLFFSALEGLPDIPLEVDLAPGIVSSISSLESIWRSGRWLALLQMTIATAVLVFSWPLLQLGTAVPPIINITIQVENWIARLLETLIFTWATWSAEANELLRQVQYLLQGPASDLIPGFEIWPWVAVLGVFWLIVNGFLLRPGDVSGLMRQRNGTVKQ